MKIEASDWAGQSCYRAFPEIVDRKSLHVFHRRSELDRDLRGA